MPTLQRCVQTRLESLQHQHRHVGNKCRRSFHLVYHCRRDIHEAEKTRTEHLIETRCGRKNFVSSLGTRLFLQATPASGSVIRMLDSTPSRKDAKKNSTDTTSSSFRDRQMTATILKQRKQKKLVESKDCFCRGQ